MQKKTITLAALALFSGTMAFSNTPLITNADFAGYPAETAFEGWIFGANQFQPKTTWKAFVTAPTAFAYTDRLAPSGDGWVFSSWDDQVHDRIETYIFNEFHAGPPGSSWPTIFSEGDVIRFKGKASSTRSGNNTDDMVVRAGIKVLGYNSQGWEFQTKLEYSAFEVLEGPLEDIDLTVVYPNIDPNTGGDDSLQVIQIGFEISGEFDGSGFDTGTIYFENIEAYIEGSGNVWGPGWPVDDLGWVDTGTWMGYLNTLADPWIWSASLNNWLYLPGDSVSTGGSWAYVLRPSAAN